MSMFMVMIFLSLILAFGCPPTRTALILHMVSVISAPPSIEVLGFGFYVALKLIIDSDGGSLALVPHFFFSRDFTTARWALGYPCKARYFTTALYSWLYHVLYNFESLPSL